MYRILIFWFGIFCLFLSPYLSVLCCKFWIKIDLKNAGKFEKTFTINLCENILIQKYISAYRKKSERFPRHCKRHPDSCYDDSNQNLFKTSNCDIRRISFLSFIIIGLSVAYVSWNTDERPLLRLTRKWSCHHIFYLISESCPAADVSSPLIGRNLDGWKILFYLMLADNISNIT